MGEIKRYTMADVKTRNGKNGNPVWIVYKDSVFDVTNYLGEVSSLSNYHRQRFMADKRRNGRRQLHVDHG